MRRRLAQLQAGPRGAPLHQRVGCTGHGRRRRSVNPWGIHGESMGEIYGGNLWEIVVNLRAKWWRWNDWLNHITWCFMGKGGGKDRKTSWNIIMFQEWLAGLPAGQCHPVAAARSRAARQAWHSPGSSTVMRMLVVSKMLVSVVLLFYWSFILKKTLWMTSSSSPVCLGDFEMRGLAL